jgi:hypothetical protein
MNRIASLVSLISTFLAGFQVALKGVSVFRSGAVELRNDALLSP